MTPSSSPLTPAILGAVLVSLVPTQADATEPAEVKARLDEIAALRPKRLDDQAPVVPWEAWEKAVSRGKVETGLVAVEGHKAKKAWAVAVLDVPIGNFWAAINDDKNKPNHSSLDYAEVLDGGVCGRSRRVFQFLPIGWGVTARWWIIDVRANDAIEKASHGRVREQHWKSNGDWTVPTATAQAWADQGMHIDMTRGSWLLVDLDGDKTMVEYYTWADPGGSLPAGLASRLAAGNIEDTFEAMTALAKKGPHCKVVPPKAPAAEAPAPATPPPEAPPAAEPETP